MIKLSWSFHILTLWDFIELSCILHCLLAHELSINVCFMGCTHENLHFIGFAEISLFMEKMFSNKYILMCLVKCAFVRS